MQYTEMIAQYDTPAPKARKSVAQHQCWVAEKKMASAGGATLFVELLIGFSAQ